MAPSRSPMPTLFVSHGAPDIVLRDMAARDFLKSYAGRIAKPKAILVVSVELDEIRPVRFVPLLEGLGKDG